MKEAIRLYKGDRDGEVVAAIDADYNSFKDLGLICPLCNEAVFLVRGSSRKRGDKLEEVSPHFSHYKEGKVCELRARSIAYQQYIEQISPQSRGQRLSLFNRRFWEIFSYKKVFPKNLKKHLFRTTGTDEETINKLVAHCWKRWDYKQIAEAADKALEESLASGNNKLVDMWLEVLNMDMESQEVIDSFKGATSPLNIAIRNEAIRWLGTKTAKESFTNLIMLGMYDLSEIKPPPWHTTDISYMALTSLALTDWVEAIANLPPAKGFGKV